jgi:hypothetical protein
MELKRGDERKCIVDALDEDGSCVADFAWVLRGPFRCQGWVLEGPGVSGSRRGLLY